jgi:hypothetical protein
MKTGMKANDNGYDYRELDRKRIWVICEDCQLLRMFEGERVREEFANTTDISPLAMISRNLVKCPKPMSGYYDRCRMTYYRTFDERVSEKAAEAGAGVRIADLRSWEVVVAGCGSCKHVTQLPRWRLLKMVDGQTTLDNLRPRLKCQKCGERGGSYITIAKLPR